MPTHAKMLMKVHIYIFAKSLQHRQQDDVLKQPKKVIMKKMRLHCASRCLYHMIILHIYSLPHSLLPSKCQLTLVCFGWGCNMVWWKNNLIYFAFILSDGELYSGTVADFSAVDALIIKKRLRTEQYDLKHLNGAYTIFELWDFKNNMPSIPLMSIVILLLAEPDFVSSVEDNDYVYFFFRESAVEYINCGKVRTIFKLWQTTKINFV